MMGSRFLSFRRRLGRAVLFRRDPRTQEGHEEATGQKIAAFPPTMHGDQYRWRRVSIAAISSFWD
jgi:hypothetical protein